MISFESCQFRPHRRTKTGLKIKSLSNTVLLALRSTVHVLPLTSQLFFYHSYFLTINNYRAHKYLVNLCKIMQIPNKPYTNFLTGLSESLTILTQS